MRTMRVVYFSLLIIGMTTPCIAQAEHTHDVSTPDQAATPTKKTGGGEPSSEGTPAVVVDDNKVESLLGKVVTSASGEKLGPVTDILVGHSGDVRAAVIDFGGFLGVGTRKVAVAWSALRFSSGAIALNMTRDELRVTPEYRGGEPIVIVGPTPAQPSPPAATAHPPAGK